MLVFQDYQNFKKNNIIKSATMKNRGLAFDLYYQELPSWYIKGSLSNLKKTDANEYCSKYCILKGMVKNKITKRRLYREDRPRGGPSRLPFAFIA